MYEALKEAGPSNAKGKPMKALMKNRQKSERIKLAKEEVSAEKRAQALQYMGEGWTPEELANRVIKKASKKKVELRAGSLETTRQ